MIQLANTEKIKELMHRNSPDNTVDLHFHSYCSDGELSPKEVVARMVNKGKKLIALTDHDGISGVAEARAEAKKLGVEFVSGIEISAEHYFQGKMISAHILGYGIEIENKKLLEKMKQLESFRKERNKQLIIALQEAGYDIDTEDVVFRAGQTYIGKPLIARALINKGYIKTKEEAFESELIFENPKIRNIRKEKISIRESIELIHGSGGIVVLAHPGRLRKMGEFESEEFYENVNDFVGELKNLGIDGLEAWYERFSTKEKEKFAQMGRKYKLILTGGSDFHGENLEAED